MLSFGQTRSARLAEKERKQREYKAELERQIEAKKLREQQERNQERQVSRELLSMNKQRENMVAPLGVGTSPQQLRHQAHGVASSPHHRQEAQYANPDAGKPTARPVVVPYEQQQPQRRHDDAVLQSEIQHSFQESNEAPAYLGGAARGELPPPQPRHDEAILRGEVQRSFQESEEAPAYLGGHARAPPQQQQQQQHFSPAHPVRAKDNFQPSATFYRKLEEERRKLAYGEELRQQMREQKERKERERKLWKFGDPNDVQVYSGHSPARHDEHLLRNEYKNSFQESADAPSYLRSHHARAGPRQGGPSQQSQARAAAAEEAERYRSQRQQAPPAPQRRHDEAILRSEIEHSFQESEEAPAYLGGHGNNNPKSPGSDKRQPMVHFRSDYRDMTALEIEEKQKKAAELHADLKRQMEEKKAAKQRERELERREEERENERVRREQEQLRRQFEGESNREHRSRRSHAAPFVSLAGGDDPQATATPGRHTQAPQGGRKQSSSDLGGATMSHPSFQIPDMPKPTPAKPRAPSPPRGPPEVLREEPRSGPSGAEASRDGLTTPQVEKRIATSVESIRSELVGNQEKVIQVINEQRQALVAETESTRQEMLQMKSMLREYQDSIQKMEQLHSEQMQMQNVYALMKREEEQEAVRRSHEEAPGAVHGGEGEVEGGAETPSWVRQAMREGGRLDLMQSLQAESTLVFPDAPPPPSQRRQPPPTPPSPLRPHPEDPIPVVEKGVVDLRLDSESDYVGGGDEWRAHPEPAPAPIASAASPSRRDQVDLLLPPRLPSRSASVASSAATLNLEELYRRNASKLRMLEDLEGEEDVDEIDHKLTEFLRAQDDAGSVSNSLENYNELDYGTNLHLQDFMPQPERLSTPCLPAESDWIR